MPDHPLPEHPLIGRLRAARVVPVVRTSRRGWPRPRVGWLRDAGLRIFEITMTIPDAPALIRELAADPALLVGAGTVADAATAAGLPRRGRALHRRALGRCVAGRALPRGRGGADAGRAHADRGARGARRRAPTW